MDTSWYFIRFGLFVTGISERKALPQLFRILEKNGICKFELIRYVKQRSPITSKKKKLKMVGTGKTIPTKDEQDIGLPARKYISLDDHHYVILIDDLEYSRRNIANQVFNRYRKAFDTILTPEQRHRASVHFLVNMLEAYYFADANAINKVIKLSPPLKDYQGDVETIRHPKNDLKKIHKTFKEVSDGEKILAVLNIQHVLSNPKTCAWLRTLFAWCVYILSQNSYFDYKDIYQLENGLYSDITKVQLSFDRIFDAKNKQGENT